MKNNDDDDDDDHDNDDDHNNNDDDDNDCNRSHKSMREKNGSWYRLRKFLLQVQKCLELSKSVKFFISHIDTFVS